VSSRNRYIRFCSVHLHVLRNHQPLTNASSIMFAIFWRMRTQDYIAKSPVNGQARPESINKLHRSVRHGWRSCHRTAWQGLQQCAGLHGRGAWQSDVTGSRYRQVKIHIVVSWIMTSCSLVVGYRHFRGPCSVHLTAQMHWLV
jgi:hypothetical protein